MEIVNNIALIAFTFFAFCGMIAEKEDKCLRISCIIGFVACAVALAIFYN